MKTRRKKSSSKRRLPLLDIILMLTMAAFLIFGGIVGSLVYSAVKDLPALSNLEPTVSQTSFVYDRNGNIWHELRSEEYRIPVEFQDIPTHVRYAVLAAEDHRFYSHYGFDLRGIFRALYKNIVEGGLQGGSTITQQLAKEAFLEPARVWKRKVQDAIVAVLLEQKYTKDEILCMYLNQIFFGRGAYGIEAASRAYFGKSVDEVTLDEAAFLAGVIRGPGYYDPENSGEEIAITRRNTVLNQMTEYGFIAPDEAETAKAKPLGVIKGTSMMVTEGGYFLDYVLKELLNRYPADLVYGGGLKVYTSYSPEVQRAAESAIKKVLDPVFPIVEGQDSIQAASVVMDPRTGQVLALVGGRTREGMLGWNRAVDALRQPGSAFKPLSVYIPALEAGIGPATVIDDAPVTWTDPITGEKFSPRNYSGYFSGLVTIRHAVRESLNVVACKVQDLIGIPKSLETAERLGITSLVKTPTSDGRSDLTRSLALGGLTYGVSPLDMAVAYGTLANRGIKVEPIVITRVEDKNGNVLEEAAPKRTIAISEETAYLMTSMLQDVLTQPGGTGRAAYIGRPCAGKTGTTNDWKDAWFCGYTPDMVGIVWMGYDQSKTMEEWKITGGTYPAQIWNAAMSEIMKNRPVEDFHAPDSVISMKVCRKSGLLPSRHCPEEDVYNELFIKDMVPTSPCTYHIPQMPEFPYVP